MQLIVQGMAKLERFIESAGNRPWFVPMIAVLAGADIFILVIPTDALVASAAWTHPKRWFATGVTVAIGSALGAICLGIATDWLDLSPWLSQWISENFSQAHWTQAVEWVRSYGGWALAGISLSPIPFQIGVAAAVMLEMPFPELFISVLAGRALKYVLLAWIAARCPQWLTKIPGVRREMRELKQAGTRLQTPADL